MEAAAPAQRRAGCIGLALAIIFHTMDPTPRHGRIYYGWLSLGIAALAMVATLPGRTQGLGLITVPLLRDLRMTDVRFASINFWATLIGAAFCIGVGRLIDTRGSRLVMSIIVIALGIDVILMSHVSGQRGLFATTTLTRGLGQSALSVVSLAIVGKWFVRRLPAAMGVYAVLVTVGFVIAFPGVQWAVEHFGWRAVWQGVGLVLLIGVAPVTIIWLRDTPESIGVTPDAPIAPLPDALTSEPSMTAGEALRTPAFWTFAFASALYNLIATGTSLFYEPILHELSLGTDAFRMLLGVSTLCGLIANLLGGWLAGFWPMGRLMAIAMLMTAVSLTALPWAHNTAGVIAYAVAAGLAGGVVIVIFFSFWGRVFGRSHLGRIQAVAQSLTVVASAFGPVLFAYTRWKYGHYLASVRLLAVVSALAGVSCWAVSLPQMSDRR